MDISEAQIKTRTEPSVSPEEVPSSATVTPSEVKETIDAHPKIDEDVSLGELKSYATGTVKIWDDERWTAVLAGIVQTNEEAKQYCNVPADVPMVLGSVGTHESDVSPNKDSYIQ
jgi:hypothetical protein